MEAIVSGSYVHILPCHEFLTLSLLAGGYDFSKEDGAVLYDADCINTVKRGAGMPVKFGLTRY